MCILALFGRLSHCTTITWLAPLPTAFCFHDLCPEKYFRNLRSWEWSEGGGTQEWFTSQFKVCSSVKHLQIYDFMWGSGAIPEKKQNVTWAWMKEMRSSRETFLNLRFCYCNIFTVIYFTELKFETEKSRSEFKKLFFKRDLVMTGNSLAQSHVNVQTHWYMRVSV